MKNSMELVEIVSSLLGVASTTVTITSVRNGSIIADFEITNFSISKIQADGFKAGLKESLVKYPSLVGLVGSAVEIPYLDQYSPYEIVTESDIIPSVDGQICLSTKEIIPFVPPTPLVQGLSYAFAAVGVAVAIAGIIFIVLFRDKAVVFYLGRTTSILLCISLVLVNVSSFVRTGALVSPSGGSCVSYLWLAGIGMAYMTSYMFIVQWQVYSSNVSDRLMYIGPFVVLVFILLVVWTVTDAASPDPCVEYRCASVTGGIIYFLFGIFVLLLIVTLVFSFLIRNTFEFKAIALSSLFSLFGLSFVGLLSLLQVTSVEAEVCIYSFSVAWCSSLATGLIVLRKLFWKDFNQEDLDNLRNPVEKYRPRPTVKLTRQQASRSLGDISKTTSVPVEELNDEGLNNEGLNDIQIQSSGEDTQALIDEKELVLRNSLREFENAIQVDESDNQSSVVRETVVETARQRARGFRIGMLGEWEEYVDRDTGENYFISSVTGEVVTTV